MIKDPLDKTLPDINKEVIIENPKTGERLVINPKIAKNVYEKNSINQEILMKKIFQDSNIDFTEFLTNEHFAINLAEFLKQRAKRRVYKKNVFKF